MNAEGLHHVVVGTGPPLLVMHGGPGFDHTYFRPWLDGLGADHSVIYYDHRGTGRSPEPEDWSRIGHDTWSDDAADLLDRLGHDGATVLGHSYGGFLALETALRHPERVRALVLCDTAPVVDYPDVVMETARARGTPEQVAVVAELLRTGAAGDEHFREAVETILPLYFHEYQAGLFERLLGRTRFRAAAQNHASAACLPDYDVRHELWRIRVPSLVLAGRHDWLCPVREGAEQLADGLPDSRLVVFEESGHFPFVEETEAFLEAVRKWEAT